MRSTSETWQYLDILNELAERPDGPGPLAEVLRRYAGREELAARAWFDLEAAERAAQGGGDKGDSLGPYRLIEEIGRGGQGVVYRAEDRRVGRTVALKVLKTGSAATEQAVARFRREAVAASAVDHPGLCTVYDAGFDDDVPYIAMQYVRGRPLAEIIAASASASDGSSVVDVPSSSEKTRRTDAVLGLVEGLARALHVAHEAGFVHRDVKPGNVIVTDEGQGVLVDFGLTRAVEQTGTLLTQPGDALGTPPYMAPEQFDGAEGAISRATDIWSLGVVLYECVTSKRPFDGPTREGLIHAIRFKDPRSVRHSDSRLPPALDAVIGAALEKEPQRRYRTARAFADDVLALREGRAVSVRPVSPLGQAARWARRSPALAAVTTLFLFALLAFAAVGVYVLAKREAIETGEAAQLAERVDALLEEGYLELGHGRGPRARGIFERALALDPSCHEAVAGLVLADLRLRDERGVASTLARFSSTPELAELEQLVEFETSPRTAFANFVAGVRALQLGHGGDESRFKHAFSYMWSALMLSPRRRAVYVMEAVHAAIHSGDLGRAKLLSDDLVAAWPDSPHAWYWHGYARLTSDPAAALRSYDEALRLAPEMALAHFHRGMVLKRQRRLGDAAAACRTAIEIVPDFQEAWRELGLVLQDGERDEEALAAFERALELNPRDGFSRVLYGELLLEEERIDEAERVLIHFASVYFFHPGYLQSASVGLLQAGRAAAARDILDRVVVDHPRHAPSWRALATIQRRDGDVDDAMVSFARAVELDPGNRKAAYNLGSLYVDAARLEEAEQVFAELTRRHPDFGPGWMQLGLALTRQSRFHDALAPWEKAHAAAANMPDWNPPSDEWVAQARGNAETEAALMRARLEGFDAATPRLRELADLARRKRWFVTAARMYEVLIERFNDDELDREAAAIFRDASSGEGPEASLLDNEALSAWRRRADDLDGD